MTKNGVRFSVKNMATWIDSGTLESRGKSINGLKSDFYRCNAGKYCKILWQSRLFHCGRAVAVYNLKPRAILDFLDVDQSLTREKLYGFWIKDYSLACDYCDNGVKEPKYIEGGVQM